MSTESKPIATTSDEIDALFKETANRMWSVHPRELRDLGITRKEFYVREMKSLFSAIAALSSQPVAATGEDDADAFESWLDYLDGTEIYAFTDDDVEDMRLAWNRRSEIAKTEALALIEAIRVGKIALHDYATNEEALAAFRAAQRTAPVVAATGDEPQQCFHGIVHPLAPITKGAEHRYAKNLAIALANRLYPEAASWTPLDDLLGILTQIDNMTARLTNPQQQMPVNTGDDELAGFIQSLFNSGALDRSVTLNIPAEDIIANFRAAQRTAQADGGCK